MTDTLFPTNPTEKHATPRGPSTRAITYTSHSIHGIQKDLKTQTRRVMYPQPKAPGPIEKYPDKMSLWHGAGGYGDPLWRCPYGVPGDRLWVREVWARVEPSPGVIEKFGMPIAWRVQKEPLLLEYWRKRAIFLADFPDQLPEECGRGASDNKWRSPVSMPRWASRLLLEVTDIRVERVQEISAKDCQAEGINVYETTRLVPPEAEKLGDAIYRDQFALLWDSINGTKNPWAANPWVWCISFRRIDKSE